MDTKQNQKYTTTEIDHCIAILTHMVTHGEDFILLPREQQIELIKRAGQLSRPDRYQRKQRNKAIRKIKKQAIATVERKARAATGIRMARDAAVFSAPPPVSG